MNTIITPEQFDFRSFRKLKAQPRKRGNQGTKQKVAYKDIITAFDIETTRIEEIEQSVMYIWQWQFDTTTTVVGRTWEQLKDFMTKLEACMRSGEKLVVFVHNLSYEFQFLRAIIDWRTEDVFAVEKRKVLKASAGQFEFRCSYLHSNMSLAEYTTKMKAEHVKLDGEEFNYKEKRYLWTPLTDRELEYCVNDVLGLVEAIKNEMALDGDNLYTFPLTSTGYVRRDAKAAMRQAPKGMVKKILPDLELYTALREAFRGGNTHANRAYTGLKLKNVSSADRSSSYPDVQCNCLFPIGEFQHVGACDIEDIYNHVVKHKRALLARVVIVNIRLRDRDWGCPYLSYSKCRGVTNPLLDNGRLLEADFLETTITDVDLRIIEDEYEWDDIIFTDVWYARYGKLPRSLVESTISYYRNKTELKGNKEQEVFYNKEKNKLNSIYGMTAQDPIKMEVQFNGVDFEDVFVKTDEESWTALLTELLGKSNSRAFLAYQWGVWTTAWARYRLEEGIRLAGKNFVYCDTDSVKYLGNIDWTKYNTQRRKDSKASGAHATDSKGNEHYMGEYEADGFYTEFKTWGAKKYAYRTQDGKLHVTIAGVNKKKGAKELEERGGLDAFKEGFDFVKAGGSESIYNDTPDINSYEVDGHTIPIYPNIVIRDSKYTVGITSDYREIISMFQKIGLDM